MSLTSDAFQRLQHWDLTLCSRCNRLQNQPYLVALLRLCSRLGDGVFWYSLMITLPLLDGWDGLRASLHMLLVGMACVTIYKWLKRKTVRERPCTRHAEICQISAPLDQYSFPSGHTLHAVAFTLVALSYYPSLAPVLVAFTALVALSRPALGLHYPSDVLAGALGGGAIAWVSLHLSAFWV